MNVALNVEQQFAAAMAEHGLVPAEIVADGQLHRFDGPGEKRGKNSGWYVLHTDDIAAALFSPVRDPGASQAGFARFYRFFRSRPL